MTYFKNTKQSSVCKVRRKNGNSYGDERPDTTQEYAVSWRSLYTRLKQKQQQKSSFLKQEEMGKHVDFQAGKWEKKSSLYFRTLAPEPVWRLDQKRGGKQEGRSCRQEFKLTTTEVDLGFTLEVVDRTWHLSWMWHTQKM